MVSGEKKLRNCNSEDRISTLPDDLIHLILSDMDAKDVIQTCIVSTRWRHVWRSVAQLNFNGSRFSKLPDFIKFVSRFLSSRSPESHISVFNLNPADIRRSDITFRRAIPHWLIKKIALHTRYAQNLNLTSNVSVCGNYGKYGEVTGVPLSVFNSSSLKKLRLISCNLIVTNFYGSSWNLQALTTLICSGVTFTDLPDKSMDYFSNLSNLRQLSLASCQTLNSNPLHIISPPLETLSISHTWGTARAMYVVSAPNLSSLNYSDNYADSILSSDGFPCLERVNIHFGSIYNKEKVIKDIIFGLFDKLSNAMSLTLSMNTVRRLSSFPELLRNQISPFCNLKLLNIVIDRFQRNSSPIPHHAITYLCNSSPSPPIIRICKKLYS